ncbi:BRCT domain-containing protein [Trichophyton interdigitale]|uniref:BRCT domain-containing protein n=1 Tax=Trichophyton interdigitale TaxID=101480 RepID=A0A9P4YKB1_9EURO|nr:BRCT domain-containing protein [Trichophyton interdigitale]KAF3897533.1 BRCT domain-containing protein [Trichophyton interdigitale]KAG8207526.1 BRCT domain-containing protein [Trichophyton interdigitale]
MGRTFKNITLSVTGEFGPIADKFKQWVEANGGSYSKEINSEVTHLLSTKGAFKANNNAVRAAKRIKGLKIVSSDWLEDSLLSKSRRPKREGPYLWSQLTKKARKTSSVRKEADKDANTKQINAGHHIYSDAAGIRYIATLVRPIEASKAKEKHILKLYESDSTPHTYAVFAKYTRPGRVGSDYTVPVGSPLSTAIKAFDKFFRAKTGKPWDRRDGPSKPRNSGGEIVPPWEDWFQYTPEPSRTSTPVIKETKASGCELPEK